MGILTVKLLSASNLSAKDVSGTSDPYAELRVGGHSQKSRTIHRTNNPYWGDVFTFNVPNPMSESLVVSLFDYDLISRNDPIGYVVIQLNTLIRQQPLLRTYDLLNASRGCITLELTAQDFGASGYAQPPMQGYGYPPQQPYPPQQQYPPQQSYQPYPPNTGYGVPPPMTGYGAPPMTGYPPQQAYPYGPPPTSYAPPMTGYPPQPYGPPTYVTHPPVYGAPPVVVVGRHKYKKYKNKGLKRLRKGFKKWF